MNAATGSSTSVDALLALYRERDQLMREADALSTAISVIERRRHFPTTDPGARIVEGRIDFFDISVNRTSDFGAALSDVDRYAGLTKHDGVEDPVDDEVDDEDDEEEEEDDEPSSLADDLACDEKDDAAEPEMPATIAQAAASVLVGVIGRYGRFAYRDQIQRELMRDGRSFGDELAGLLKRLIADRLVARVRYNGANRCVAYGLPRWIDEGRIAEDREPIGRSIDRGTAEITLGGAD